MSLKIFFSHAWKDKAEANVKILMNELKRIKNYNIWLDRYEIQLGENINSAIEKAIADSHVVIVAWSRNASESNHVLDELKMAHAYKKPLIPCIIDGFMDSQSEYIKDLEWIEIKGNHKHDLPQLAMLRDYLISYELKQTAANPRESTAQLQRDLEKKHKATSHLLRELEDIHHRQKIGASGNEASDVFVQSALTEAINVASMNSNPKIQEFFLRMMQATERFPGPENNANKVNFLLETLVDLDPDGTDLQFQKFYKSALETFGLMAGKTDQQSELIEGKTSEDDKQQELSAGHPTGEFFDNEWFGVRVYIGDGQVQEKYTNGAKVYFPDKGTALIYFYFSFHKEINEIATYLVNLVDQLRNNGTAVETGEFESPSGNCVVLEMAYYDTNNQLQYEYLGGYLLANHRGFIMEIITSDATVCPLYRELFAEKVYLLNETYTDNKQDDQLFRRLVNRKLLSISSSSSGYGSFYSASSTQKHFRLFETGEFDYYYAASNSGSIGMVNSEERESGQWGVYTEEGQKYIWFKWNKGVYEACALEFGNDADVYLNQARYYIVGLDYTV